MFMVPEAPKAVISLDAQGIHSRCVRAEPRHAHTRSGCYAAGTHALKSPEIVGVGVGTGFI